jgi:hypothetical protein
MPVERWALYARISRVMEASDTEGVSRQLADGRAAVARRGGTVVAELVDNDISASRFSTRARSNHRRVLDMVEAGEVDGVWIWMEDRLHRQVIELAEFLKACEQAGVTKLASAGGEFNLADPDQRMLLYIRRPWPRPRWRSRPSASAASGWRRPSAASAMPAAAASSARSGSARTLSRRPRPSASGS